LVCSLKSEVPGCIAIGPIQDGRMNKRHRAEDIFSRLRLVIPQLNNDEMHQGNKN
jgi:hypothetical protein